MTTRTRPDEDVPLENEAAQATQKRRRLSSPQQDEQPSRNDADVDVISLYGDDIEATQTSDRDVVSGNDSMQKDPVDVQASRALTEIPAQDTRINHNDGSARSATSRVLQRQLATINTHIGEDENQSRASSSRDMSAPVPRAPRCFNGAASSSNNTTIGAFGRTSGELYGPHYKWIPPRWSAAQETALVEFVSRDAVLLAWATSTRALGASGEADIIVCLERFLSFTPVTTARSTFFKLQRWREVYHNFYVQLTLPARSARVSAWCNPQDRMLLAKYEAESRSACQWHRLWHDLITLNLTARSAGDAFVHAPSSHERTYAAMPLRSQTYGRRPEASNFTFTSQHSFNHKRFTNTSNSDTSPQDMQVPSSSSYSSAFAALEIRVEELERQNSLLQAENKQHQSQLDQQKSLMERQNSSLQAENKMQRQLLERQEFLIESQAQQLKRSEQQVERLQKQTELLEQTVEKQAQALDRNTLALERRAQAAEREAQKLERLEQRINGQPQ